MNPTLTKNSEALRESLSDWQGNGDLPTFAVIAVLEAIREPSKDMMTAGYIVSEHMAFIDDGAVRGEMSRIWRAMIDSLLHDQTTNPTANHGSGE